MKEKPKPKPDQIGEFPDAWERFEKAFDTVMKAKPKPAPAKPIGRYTRARPVWGRRDRTGSELRDFTGRAAGGSAFLLVD
jgi:hypothetical protein